MAHPETQLERIERARNSLRSEFESFKSEFLPYRSRFEDAATYWFRFPNSAPNAFEGHLHFIERLIEDNIRERYLNGRLTSAENVFTLGWSVSRWLQAVRTSIRSGADKIATHLGTSYTIGSELQSDGHLTVFYKLVAPVANELAERLQAALVAAFGIGWPLLPADQLSQLNFQILQFENAVGTYTTVLLSQPENESLWGAKIETAKAGIIERIPWREYISSGVLPGDLEPEAILSAPPLKNVYTSPGEDEVTLIVNQTEGMLALQTPEIIDATAEALGGFADSEQVKKDIISDPALVDLSLFSPGPAQIDPAIQIDVELEVQKDILVAEPDVDGGFIPEPSDPVDKGIIDPGGFFGTGKLLEIEEVDAFVKSFDTLADGIGDGTAEVGTADPATDANDSSLRKKALLAAVVGALIFRM